jgi:hydroxypyruvate isomerase
MFRPNGISRRLALALPLATAVVRNASAAAGHAPKLSVRVEPLFPALSLPEQLERVADAGYQGFEFGDWRAQDARKINAIKNRLGLECVNIVGNRGVNPKGMGLCDPQEREGFLAEVQASLEAAQRFETKMIVVLTGFVVRHLARQQQHDSIVEGLKRGSDLAARAGVTLIVEPINTLAKVEPLIPTGNNHADYYLDKTAEAIEIIQKVNSPFVKILYDLYHAQIMEGNLTVTIREQIQHFAHIHVGDVPGRHQPGTGEIHYGNVFRAIAETGYAGYLGMEYVPQGDAMQSLRDTKKLAVSSFSLRR